MGIFAATITSSLITFSKQLPTSIGEDENPGSQISNMLFTWTVLWRIALLYSGTIMETHISRKE